MQLQYSYTNNKLIRVIQQPALCSNYDEL